MGAAGRDEVFPPAFRGLPAERRVPSAALRVLTDLFKVFSADHRVFLPECKVFSAERRVFLPDCRVISVEHKVFPVAHEVFRAGRSQRKPVHRVILFVGRILEACASGLDRDLGQEALVGAG